MPFTKKRLLIATVLGGLLCLLPATQLLGYEYAFAATLGAVLLVPFWADAKASERLALLGVPLALGLLNALRVQNCNLPSGVAWYLLLVVPQATLASGLFRSLRRWRLLIYYAILLALLLRALFGVFDGPSIRVYDPLLGFYAGSLYDESLPMPTALFWHQAWVLMLAAAIALARHRIMLVLPLGLLWLGWLCGGALGFNVGRRELHEALSEVMVTDHLVIHHQPRGRVAQQRSLIWPEAERIAQRLTAKMQVQPQRPTHVYLYDDPAVKERLLGARDTYFTRTWKPEIHITYTGAELNVLDHELVHAFASEWAGNRFGVPLRYGVLPAMALIEGLAVALAEPYGPPALAATAALSKTGKLPDLTTLFSPLGFYAEASERAYTTAGAFVTYWIDTRGLQAVREAYKTGELDVASATQAFNDHLARLPVSEALTRAYSEALRGKPLYRRVCGREQALRRDEASQALTRGDLAEARRCVENILRDDPSDLDASLLLLDIEGRAGAGPEQLLAAREHLARRKDLTLNAELHLLEYQLDAGTVPQNEAVAITKLGEQKAVRADERRRWFVKRRLVESGRADLLITLRTTTPATTATNLLWLAYHQAPNDPLIAYLLARRVGASDPILASQLLTRAIDEIDLPLRFETQRLLLEWAYLRGDKALPGAEHLTAWADTESEKAVAALWSVRAEFYAAHPTW